MCTRIPILIWVNKEYVYVYMSMYTDSFHSSLLYRHLIPILFLSSVAPLKCGRDAPELEMLVPGAGIYSKWILDVW